MKLYVIKQKHTFEFMKNYNAHNRLRYFKSFKRAVHFLKNQYKGQSDLYYIATYIERPWREEDDK